MATLCTLHRWSQATAAWRSAVKVAKVRTGCGSLPAGTQRAISRAPMSAPATSWRGAGRFSEGAAPRRPWCWRDLVLFFGLGLWRIFFMVDGVVRPAARSALLRGKLIDGLNPRKDRHQGRERGSSPTLKDGMVW